MQLLDFCNYCTKVDGIVIISHFLEDIEHSLTAGDSDLDILCKSNKIKAEIIKLFKAKKIYDNRLSSAFYFYVDGKKIYLDLFTLNDYFYPKKWAINMLKNKIIKNNYPILDETNFQFSFLYHSFFHKKEINEQSISKMHKLFNNCEDYSWYYYHLISFMDKNKYHFTRTLDYKRINNIDSIEIKKRTRMPLYVFYKHFAARVFKFLKLKRG